MNKCSANTPGILSRNPETERTTSDFWGGEFSPLQMAETLTVAWTWRRTLLTCAPTLD